jgi:hypothetical protein
MKDTKSAKTPMGNDGHLVLNEGGMSVDKKVYRSMIGSLLYLFGLEIGHIANLYELKR